eukprot:555854-Amphidinium_carterae.2
MQEHVGGLRVPTLPHTHHEIVVFISYRITFAYEFSNLSDLSWEQLNYSNKTKTEIASACLSQFGTVRRRKVQTSLQPFPQFDTVPQTKMGESMRAFSGVDCAV